MENENEGLNLDAMNEADLWDMWARTHHHPVIEARRIFPSRPTGYVAATKSLGNYASNKSVAVSARIAGNIQTAMIYETICERIYESLPGFARW